MLPVLEAELLETLKPYHGTKTVSDTATPHLGGSIAGGDPLTYAPSVWDYCIDRFGLRSVLDLGSGSGNAAVYFHRRGMAVVAVEGFRASVMTSLYPAVLLDLTKGPVITNVDFVHCQEVVEHIEERFVENLLTSLTAGKFILITHAVPGQAGHHHVNLQLAAYWVEHLARHNCTLLAQDTRRIRELAKKDGACFLADTGMVFANNSRL